MVIFRQILTPPATDLVAAAVRMMPTPLTFGIFHLIFTYDILELSYTGKAQQVVENSVLVHIVAML